MIVLGAVVGGALPAVCALFRPCLLWGAFCFCVLRMSFLCALKIMLSSPFLPSHLIFPSPYLCSKVVFCFCLTFMFAFLVGPFSFLYQHRVQCETHRCFFFLSPLPSLFFLLAFSSSCFIIIILVVQGLEATLPNWLSNEYALSTSQISLIFSFWSIPFLILTPLLGAFIDASTHQELWLILGSFLEGLSYPLCAIPSAISPLWLLIVGLGVNR